MKKVIKTGFVAALCLGSAPVFAQLQDMAVYGVLNPSVPLTKNGGIDVHADDFFAPHGFERALHNPLWPADWRDPDAAGSRYDEVSLRYGWRNVRLEGSLSANRETRDSWLRLRSDKSSFASSRRISLSSHKNWTFQISRGRLSRADQVDSQDEIKRTTISTVYDYPFDNARWMTTVAYGRSGKKADGSVGNAYLFESMLQMQRRHIVFARAERASADELFREREALHGQNFNTNRYTLGYVYTVPSKGLAKLTMGSLASKRLVPAEHVATVGKEALDYKVFVKLSIPMR